jgi:integrase
MATIRQRGKSWYAEVRLKGKVSRKSFKTKAAANSWVLQTEGAIDSNKWVDVRESRTALIENIIDLLIYSYERFGIQVAGPKLSALTQIKTYFHGTSIHLLTVDEVLNFAAYRRRTVSGSTLQKQMYYFKQAIDNSRIRTEVAAVDIAIEELKRKKIIKGSRLRDRRLEPGEYELLMREAEGHWIGPVIDFALATGMRQGEIWAFKWSDIDEKAGTLTSMRKDKDAELGKSKHEIPLLEGVREALLRSQNVVPQGPKLVPVSKAASISDKFAKLTKAANIVDLKFHDLRHEAISRMFERGMTIEQVRVVSGHRSFEQLARYVNLRAADLTGL